MQNVAASNIDEYIASFPKDIQNILGQVRSTVRKAAPAAEEGINYGMPSFKFNGKPLIYFAAFKNHVGLYATPSGHAAFQKELSIYKQGKGSVQFPLDRPMPLDLISRITKFRMGQYKEKEKDFLSHLSAPARRALENNGIKTLKQLARHSESEVMNFHGIGKTAMPVLQKALQDEGLRFNASKKAQTKKAL